MPNVENKCTTHHYACDCREEKIQSICKIILQEHDLRQKRIVSVYGVKTKECNCFLCEIARELLKGKNDK